MSGGQRARHPYSDAHHFLPGRRPASLLQVAPGDVLVGDIRPSINFTDAVHGHDVGVRQAGHRARLGQEPLSRRPVQLLGQDEFDRHRPVQHVFVRQVDPPHATLSDQTAQLEAVETRRRRPLRAGIRPHERSASYHRRKAL